MHISRIDIKSDTKPSINILGALETAIDPFGIARFWRQAAIDICAATTNQVLDLLKIPYQAIDNCLTTANLYCIYEEAKKTEQKGTAVPQKEEIYDFCIRKKVNAGLLPPTTITTKIPDNFPFCRVWSFDCAREEKPPIFIFVMPDSGLKEHISEEVVHALLPYGNVRLIAKIDPHYVKREKDFTHPNTYGSWGAAIAQLFEENSQAFAIAYSGAGPVTIAAATKAQTSNKAPLALAIIGSPLDPHCDMTNANRLALETTNLPLTINIGTNYPGKDRAIVPGKVTKALLFPSPLSRDQKVMPQAMELAHIKDTLALCRQNLLMNGELVLGDQKITCEKMAKFKGSLITLSGQHDNVVPSAQVKAAHDLLPNASLHRHFDLDCDHLGLVSRDVLKTTIPAIMRILNVHPSFRPH